METAPAEGGLRGTEGVWNGEERRSGRDRRSGLDRRSGKDRRSGLGFRPDPDRRAGMGEGSLNFPANVSDRRQRGERRAANTQ